jgi:TonB-dependent starch-binding outer membrane protein SusC
MQKHALQAARLCQCLINCTRTVCLRHRYITKTLLVMKLTILLLTVGFLNVHAKGISQSITFKGKNVSLEKVFAVVKKQTGYFFFYNDVLLQDAKTVNINADNLPLNDFLDKVFAEQELTYNIESKSIIISRKNLTGGLNPGFRPQDFSLGSLLAIPPVTGIVRGPDGQPIANANVVIKGTKKGTITTADGSFSIEANNEDVVIISSIGFADGQITVHNNSLGIVTMTLSESKLDEVQIIAYGTTTKRLNTGNISSINADDIKTQPINNPLLALAGRTTGIVIEQTAGLAGTGLRIKIQGQNSISKGTDPFYVVDGIPYPANLLPTSSSILGNSPNNGTDFSSGTGNPFSFINPGDIESIQILKDADATAIYGSRAANGAILITTKKGKSGRTNVDVNFQQGFGKVTRRMNLLNTQQYLDMRKEAYTNDGMDIPTSTLPVTDKNPSNYDLTVYDLNRYTDWQKVLLGGSSKYTDLQASISGGSNQTTFRLNGSYHRETTVFPGDFSDVKSSIGFNLNHTSSDQKFKLQFSASYLNDNNQLPGEDLTGTALKLSPNAPELYNTDGSLNWERIEVNPSTHDSVSTYINPLRYTLINTNFKTDNLMGNANLSYTILKGLDARASFGYSKLSAKELYATPLNYYLPEERSYSDRFAHYGTSEIKNWIIEPQLTYNTVLGMGHLNVLVGSTFQETNSDNIRYRGSVYPNDMVLADIRSASKVSVLGDHLLSQYNYAALFGKINYNFNNKYIINLTARRDGSSRFGSAEKFHTFGAIGAAWLFSSESFVKDNLSFLSFGKLRGSYGSTGNDQIGNYSFLNIYNVIAGGVPYNGYNGIGPSTHFNPYLQWELTRKLQAGLELGFIQDKILFNVNYYHNQSSNQLVTYTLPYITGFGDVTKNFPATVRNTGWEFSVNTINLKNKLFTWTSSFNMTIARNKLVKFENLEGSPYKEQLAIGAPVNITKVFKYAGINAETGDMQFKSAAGEIVAFPDFEKDRYFPVDIAPRYHGGLQNSFSFKGFDFSFLFQFTKQIAANNRLSGPIGDNLNQSVDVLTRWQKTGDQTDIPKFSTFNYPFYGIFSSYVYSDASYVRLKNASFSWNVPAGWLNPAKIKNVRLYVQGQNLFTITKYTGLDPETKSNSSLPPLRVVTFGAQVTL